MKTKVSKTAPAFHYYGSTAFTWIVGASKQYVAYHLAREAGGLFTANKKKNGGLEAILMKVELPQAAHYTISDYSPRKIVIDGNTTKDDVPISEFERVLITDLKGNYKTRE